MTNYDDLLENLKEFRTRIENEEEWNKFTALLTKNGIDAKSREYTLDLINKTIERLQH